LQSRRPRIDSSNMEVKDDRILLVRFIAEQLGAFVIWNVELQRVTLVFVKP